MKKIGILTLTGDNNYGNKLQNYAMERIIRNMGFEVETIRVAKKPYVEIVIKTYLQCLILPLLPKSRKNKIKRRMKFLAFNKKINQSRICLFYNDQDEVIEKKLQKFDFLVYGSDQIWNPELPTFSEIYLGKYVERQKNIAVSASFGVSYIPARYVEVFKQGLQRFAHISIREEAGRKAILNLDIGIEPVTLIDPTLMLDAESWKMVEKKVKIPANYCLTYVLGDFDKWTVNAIKEQYNCECLNAGTKESYGPGEFIFLIRNAEVIITDSFHAAVFSIIFGKDLYVLWRKDKYSSMGSRIETLLEKTGVQYYRCSEYVHVYKDSFNEERPVETIAHERKKFNDFLKDSFRD